MAIFCQVLVEKDGRVTQLTNLNFVDLRRIMVNGGFNVVILTDDRTVFFDKDNQGRYGHYDLHIFENSDEKFDRVVLSKYESSKIEASQVKNYRPVPAGKHRKSPERGSSIPTGKFSDLFR